MKNIIAAVAASLLLTGTAVALPPSPPTASPTQDRPWLIPPVDASIASRFEAPGEPFGAGHRGIDYAVSAGVEVRAAADGRVAFAGFVPGGDAVTIEHQGGMETTYSLLSDAHVADGTFVAQGHFIGTAERAHGGAADGLHFGVKIEGAYVDPELYLGPLDVSGAIRLAPLAAGAERRRAATSPATAAEDRDAGCEGPGTLPTFPIAPNDNIAVVVGGIASATEGGASYEAFEVPDRLGYDPHRTYVFSYRGVDGPNHHEPYARRDTYASLAQSAGRLTALMLRLAEDHPGAGVDLIAHSQGGVIARTYLQRAARAWQAGLPAVEHLVTFATPHHGTEAASLAERFRDGPYFGPGLAEAADWLSERGLPIPDPDSAAMRELAVDSNLIDDLARGGVLYGTRVLSLASPNDLAVPVPRALYRRGRTAVIDTGSWLRSHSMILTAPRALALTHRFLRDGASGCDEEGTASTPFAARAIEFVQRWGPAALRLVEGPFFVGGP
jgi:Peptidase family M23/Palmitoyl protein thioesterase